MRVSTKGGFKSEDTEEFFRCQNKYSKSLSWAENLNKLFTVLGGKFKFSAQDSDLEYLFWQRKNSPVSSDLKPPLVEIKMVQLKILFLLSPNHQQTHILLELKALVSRDEHTKKSFQIKF